MMKLPNGYGSVYRLPGNRRRPWRAQVTTGWTEDGKQLRYTVGYFQSRQEALTALADYRKNPIGEKRDATFGQIYDDWSETEYKRLAPGGVSAYKAMWKRFEALRDVPIRHIKTSDLQKIVDGMLDEGLSRSSLEKAKTLAGILFEVAVNDDIIDRNYARAIRLPPSRKPKRETYTDAEIRLVEQLAKAGDIWAGTIMILLYTGMRIGELVTLTRFQVDAENWIITGGIKTDAGRDRIVPVHSKILPYIRYWYESKGPRLIHRDGQPISVDYYRKHLYYPTLQRAGVKRHLTPHTTRHTFATLLDRAKVNTKHIQDLIGHSSYTVTADVYTHPRIEELRAAIEAI